MSSRKNTNNSQTRFQTIMANIEPSYQKYGGGGGQLANKNNQVKIFHGNFKIK